MRSRATALLSADSLITVSPHTVFEHFTGHDQWVPLVAPDGTVGRNMIVPGEFYCTGGGEPDPTVPVGCTGGTGIHIRDLQGVSCVFEPVMNDWRLQGIPGVPRRDADGSSSSTSV